MERMTKERTAEGRITCNSCFVGDDGILMFRGCGKEMPAYMFARMLAEKVADDAFRDDTKETFDNAMKSYNSYGICDLDSMGRDMQVAFLVSMLYDAMDSMGRMHERLKYYEDIVYKSEATSSSDSVCGEIIRRLGEFEERYLDRGLSGRADTLRLAATIVRSAFVGMDPEQQDGDSSVKE